MEYCRFLKNGQWVLEKWDQKRRAQANDWAESGMRRHLKDLPEAKGVLRNAMLGDLRNEIKGGSTRTNSTTGEKEYLLHRVKHKKRQFTRIRTHILDTR